MPRQKDLKRLVRARMRKTGEAYTAARTHIVGSRPVAKRPAAHSSTVPKSDYARIAGMSDTAVAAKTGRTWERWVAALDRRSAATMSHREIAALVHDGWKVGNWWSQMVAVGYERIRGLRERGQQRTGQFTASKSRTFDVPAGRLYAAVSTGQLRARWLPDAARVRSASRGRSARLLMRDGSIAAFWFAPKGGARTTLSVQQEKLPDRAAREKVKRYWGERLDALQELLET